MRAFLLIAHGSRRTESNEEVFALIESLRPKLESSYDLLQAAFLELCDPGIGAAIDSLIEKGAQEIVILPYFLNQGRHVSEDVPHEILAKQSQHPDLTIKTLPYFGKASQITDIVVKLLAKHDA